MDAKAFSLRLVGIVCLLTVMPVVGQAQEQATIWSFLGIPQAYNHLHGALANRGGKHPGLEKKAPVTGLADPANLESDVPIIKKAAEIKKAEDLKKQKIKAVRYLTEIGCGCYDTDGSVTEALLAASDDCTEEVRLTTVQSIAQAASRVCCENCGETCCCNKKILLRLAEMAYERDDSGCFLEPSTRVRQAAAEALQICCPGTGPIVMEEPQVQPKVGPKRETVEDALDPPPVPPEVDPNASLQPRGTALFERVLVSVSSGDSGSQPAGTCQGVVVHANADHRLAHVHLDQADVKLPVGTRLSVYREALGGSQYQGEMVVVQTFSGSANVRPANGAQMTLFQPGCIVKLAESRVAHGKDAGKDTVRPQCGPPSADRNLPCSGVSGGPSAKLPPSGMSRVNKYFALAAGPEENPSEYASAASQRQRFSGFLSYMLGGVIISIPSHMAGSRMPTVLPQRVASLGRRQARVDR